MKFYREFTTTQKDHFKSPIEQLADVRARYAAHMADDNGETLVPEVTYDEVSKTRIAVTTTGDWERLAMKRGLPTQRTVEALAMERDALVSDVRETALLPHHRANRIRQKDDELENELDHADSYRGHYNTCVLNDARQRVVNAAQNYRKGCEFKRRTFQGSAPSSSLPLSTSSAAPLLKETVCVPTNGLTNVEEEERQFRFHPRRPLMRASLATPLTSMRGGHPPPRPSTPHNSLGEALSITALIAGGREAGLLLPSSSYSSSSERAAGMTTAAAVVDSEHFAEEAARFSANNMTFTDTVLPKTQDEWWARQDSGLTGEPFEDVAVCTERGRFDRHYVDAAMEAGYHSLLSSQSSQYRFPQGREQARDVPLIGSTSGMYNRSRSLRRTADCPESDDRLRPLNDTLIAKNDRQDTASTIITTARSTANSRRVVVPVTRERKTSRFPQRWHPRIAFGSAVHSFGGVTATDMAHIVPSSRSAILPPMPPSKADAQYDPGPGLHVLGLKRRLSESGAARNTLPIFAGGGTASMTAQQALLDDMVFHDRRGW